LSKEEAWAKITELKSQATVTNFSDLVKENSTEPGADVSGGELGWFRKSMMVEPFAEAAFNMETESISEPVETDFGYHLIYKKGERKIEEYKIQHIFIDYQTEADIIGEQTEWKNTELTGKNLEKAVVQFDPNDNSPQVSLQFDGEGAQMFEDITSRNVGKPVAIFLDSYPISIPTVNEKITGGQAVITGQFTIQDAKLLAQRLNAGALPVPIELINQQTVGASLGKISIANSLKAGIIGLLLVALFMIIYYRLPGLLSVLSLIIYGAVVLAIFKPVSIWLAIVLVVVIVMLMYATFNDLKIADAVLVVLLLLIGVVLVYFFQAPITLTLAGVAGFILSIGMAVDANILIFSRMREELKIGKTMDMAIEEGFRRAWPSIRDGNLSTIITCLILIGFGTGAIQGFGTTLLIGVTISMFSAIVVTRNFLYLFPHSWLDKMTWLIGVKK
jgi:preprotein translocase subunit SecD